MTMSSPKYEITIREITDEEDHKPDKIIDAIALDIYDMLSDCWNSVELDSSSSNCLTLVFHQ